MRKRFLGMSIVGVLVLLAVSPAALMAQRTSTRPAATPVRNDLKITYRTTTSGQSMETTTMLKGARERSEMKLGSGMDIINVTQCDLKRTIQISDSARKYVITPMETADSSSANPGVRAASSSEPAQRGGVITYTTTSVDTGERKEMFGFQARHIKKTIVMESSPDACSPMTMRMETDGWYIDFSFGLNCEVGRQQMMGGPQARSGGCRDTVRVNQQGSARTGYALVETTTSYGPDGSVAFTSTKEVVELSREPLDAALFDVPAGYVETNNTQDLYARPSIAAMTSQMSQGRSPVAVDPNNGLSENTKAPGVVRVGVVQINNRTDRAISSDSLRARLIANIEGNGIEAIALNAISPGAAETEAKAKQCDFILYTDITALKISAATAKEEGDEASAGTAMDLEARQVSAEARKKARG